jgi:hypothetical protein
MKCQSLCVCVSGGGGGGGARGEGHNLDRISLDDNEHDGYKDSFYTSFGHNFNFKK